MAMTAGAKVSHVETIEQATHARREPGFLPNVGARPEIGRAYDPR